MASNNDFDIKIGVEAQIDEKKVQSQIDNKTKNVKLKADVEINEDKVYKEAQKQLKILYDLKKQYANVQSPTKDEVYYYEQAIKKAQELYNIAHAKTSEPNVYDFQKRNELELKSIQYESQLSSIIDKQTKNTLSERISAENKIQAEFKQTAKNQQAALTLNSNKNIFGNQITTYMNQNTKAAKMFGVELLDLQNKLKKTDNVTDLNNLKKEFTSIKSEATALGVSGQTTLQKFKNDFKNFTTFLSAGTILMSGVNTVRQLVSTVSVLDKSLVDLQQATGYSHQQAQQLLNTYIDLGKQLGATGTEVANSAGEWLNV